MNRSKTDLYRVLCAVAIAGGVAACDAPNDENRIGPEDFRQGHGYGEEGLTTPGQGGGLEPGGDPNTGTDLMDEEPSSAPPSGEPGSAGASGGTGATD